MSLWMVKTPEAVPGEPLPINANGNVVWFGLTTNRSRLPVSVVSGPAGPSMNHSVKVPGRSLLEITGAVPVGQNSRTFSWDEVGTTPPFQLRRLLQLPETLPFQA